MYPGPAAHTQRRVHLRAKGCRTPLGAPVAVVLELFRARCRAEGISKARVAATVGRSAALSEEKAYARAFFRWVLLETFVMVSPVI